MFRDVPHPGAVWPPAHLRVGQGPEEGESLLLSQAEQAELQARDAHAQQQITLKKLELKGFGFHVFAHLEQNKQNFKPGIRMRRSTLFLVS